MDIDEIRQNILDMYNSGIFICEQGDSGDYYLSFPKSYGIIRISSLFYGIIFEKEEFFIEKNEDLVKKTLTNLYNTIKNKETNQSNQSYIKIRFTILPETIVNSLANYLKILFNKRLQILFATLGILFTIYFSYYQIKNSIMILTSWEDIFLAYILILIVLLFHELGHASATKYFGLKPKEVGLGLYIIFPVFYANVTEIWKLNKNKRIIINLGGIYFQLLANIILFILFFFVSPSLLVVRIFSVNTFILLYSIIPFLRSDGYWVYSDYFNIPNLMQKANYYYISGLKSKKNYPLLVFSIGNSLFLIYILYLYFKIIQHTYIDFLDIFDDSIMLISDLTILIFKTIVVTFFLVVFLRGQYVNIQKKIKNSDSW